MRKFVALAVSVVLAITLAVLGSTGAGASDRAPKGAKTGPAAPAAHAAQFDDEDEDWCDEEDPECDDEDLEEDEDWLDEVPPQVKITKATCAAAKCTVDVTVTDAEPSSGIAAVEGTVRTTFKKAGCRGKAGGRACTATESRRMTAKRLAEGRYRLQVARVRKGTHELRVTAVDNEDNRSKVARVTRTTR
jgi:hypothetical protein